MINVLKKCWNFILFILKSIWGLLVYSIKKWNWTILWIAVVIFAILEYKNASAQTILILGGGILLLYGINSVLSKSQFRLSLMSNSLMISAGVISIITAILLPKSIDIFALVFLFIVGINILLYYASQRRSSLIKNLLSLLIFTLIFYINVGLISGIFSYLKGAEGFVWSSYILLLALFVIIFFSSFAFIEKLVICSEGIAKKINPRISISHNRFLYLAIAANLVIFIAGYFYLQYISTEKTRDFMVIIGIALVSSFSSVSALKDIWNN